VDLGEDQLLCQGESINLDVTQTGSTYEWQDGSTDPTYFIFISGTYRVKVSNSCGTASDEFEVLFDRRPDPIDLGPDQTLCISDSLVLDATVTETSTAPVSYRWRLGETNPILKPGKSATYWVEATNRCGTSADTIVVVLEVLPKPDMGPDTLRCPDEVTLLDATVPGRPAYRWHDGSTGSTFQAMEEGVYKVEVSNTCGTGSDSIALKTVDCSCTVYLPNAFTPNADNVNDLFGPAYDCDISDVTLKIYSRWGNLVFETDNPDEAWDGNRNGKPVAEGVYVWVLQYQGYRNKIKRLENKTGTVTVIR
jgi:gliding motility-associated-like protein